METCMNDLEKIYCVYKHTNKFNSKVYIGITSQIPEKRWKNGYGYEGNEYFYRAIQKYGWGNGFEHEIIASGLTKADACAMEVKLIELYDSTNSDKGYNFSIGGDCGNAGCSRSEVWLEKMKESLRKPVICIESSIVYKSVKHAEEQTDIRAGSIGAACRGDYGHRTAGGLHWCFWDEDWNNFKKVCKKLNVDYVYCDKCGVPITQGVTRPRKYCSQCSGRKPIGIREKYQMTDDKTSKKSKKGKPGINKKRPMKRIKFTK